MPVYHYRIDSISEVYKKKSKDNNVEVKKYVDSDRQSFLLLAT